MKVRNELNALLYRYKMNDITTGNKTVYINICSGDTDKVKIQISEGELSLTDERMLSENALKNAVYHFILAAAAVSAACTETGMGQTEACTLADIYIKKTDGCRTVDTVNSLLTDMCLDFTERMNEIRKESVISLHIRRCINYIYENLGADLSVKSLAVNAGLDPAYLSRLFRKETGQTLKNFVKHARVDTAQNLLRYSDLSYLVIANSLGFSSQSAFISVFKEITGITPKVYRERYYAVGS